jgi:hypothetical protein
MKTDLFLGDCVGIGTGDPTISCKKKFVMTFYDSKLHKHDSIGSLISSSNYIPLNQCDDCKNNIFQQVGGIYEKNDRWQ